MDVVDDVFLCIVGLALSWWQQLGWPGSVFNVHWSQLWYRASY